MKRRISIFVIALMLLDGCASTGEMPNRINIVDPLNYKDCSLGHIRVRRENGELRCVVTSTLCSGPYTITVYPEGNYYCEHISAEAQNRYVNDDRLGRLFDLMIELFNIYLKTDPSFK